MHGETVKLDFLEILRGKLWLICRNLRNSVEY